MEEQIKTSQNPFEWTGAPTNTLIKPLERDHNPENAIIPLRNYEAKEENNASPDRSPEKWSPSEKSKLINPPLKTKLSSISPEP